MPRNVRNFWLELEVDGKKTKVATGPVRKDGGFTLDVKMRDMGCIMIAGQIVGQVVDDKLFLVWEPSDWSDWLPDVETVHGQHILCQTER
jgi:hypothetical protein